jgi:hypothetical protein
MRGPGRAVPLPANVRLPQVRLPGPGCVAFGPDNLKLRGAPAPAPSRPGVKQVQIRCGAAIAPHVYGKGWLSVAILPAALPPGRMNIGNVAGAAGEVTQSLAGRGGGPGFEAILSALMRSAQPVHGSWGSGRLIRTSLFSVLITNNGRVLIGAVTPQVLYAAAAQAK